MDNQRDTIIPCHYRVEEYKNWWNESINNLEPDLYNINANSKLGENTMPFTPYHPDTKNLFVLRFYGPVVSSAVSLPNHTFTGQD